jgi:hypothetical protein
MSGCHESKGQKDQNRKTRNFDSFLLIYSSVLSFMSKGACGLHPLLKSDTGVALVSFFFLVLTNLEWFFQDRGQERFLVRDGDGL